MHMDDKIILKKTDMTHLIWSKYRHSSGTAGSFLKAYEEVDGKKIYYKLSAFNRERGVYGHECVNEVIVDRLLTLFDIDHVPYRLIRSDVIIEGDPYEAYVCASDDFKKSGEKKIAFDIYYEKNKKEKEKPIGFCDRMGWRKEIDAMLLIDYLILNRDRHGANIEVLKDPNTKKTRLAPLYDHGLSLLFSCITKEEVRNYDVMEDKRIQCFVGSDSAKENLNLIKRNPVNRMLSTKDREYLFYNMDDVIPEYLQDAIWDMIIKRWKAYEDMQNKR